MSSIRPSQCILRAVVSIFDRGGDGGLITDRGDVAAAVGVVNRRWAGYWWWLQGNLPWRDLRNSGGWRELSPVGGDGGGGDGVHKREGENEAWSQPHHKPHYEQNVCKQPSHNQMSHNCSNYNHKTVHVYTASSRLWSWRTAFPQH